MYGYRLGDIGMGAQEGMGTNERGWRGGTVIDPSNERKGSPLGWLYSLSTSADILAVLVFICSTICVFFTSLGQLTPVRVLFGVPLLFFIPGYALVSALFPRSVTYSAGNAEEDIFGSLSVSIGWRKRVSLSFGSSVILQPLFAIVIAISGFRYTAPTVTSVFISFTLLFTAVAVARRNQFPPNQRFQIPYNQWRMEITNSLGLDASKTSTALSAALVVVIIASLVGVGYAATVPNTDERYTSVTLLAENDNGELIAGNYPDSLVGAGAEFSTRIENNEGERVSYTVVGELQRVDSSAPSPRVLERETVMTTSMTVEAGASETYSHSVLPTMSGENLRLIYYVYIGEAPSEPNTESAHRHVHIWVDVPV